MKNKITKTTIKTLLLSCFAILCVSATEAFAQNDISVSYIHTDADGTPFAATDEQGNVEWQIEHQPYGVEHSNTEVRRESTLSFAGKAYDEEIGLSYFGGRWYSPELGRFMSIDPEPVNPEDWKTFNRYSYGFNNPYKYVDPDGNFAVLVLAGIALFAADVAVQTFFAPDVPFESGEVQSISVLPGPASSAAVAGKVGVTVARNVGKNVTNGTRKLSKSQKRGIKSLNKQIKKHEQKIREFKANPTVRPGMENLPEEVIKKQQQVRVKHFETEIKTFKNNIKKIKKGGK